MVWDSSADFDDRGKLSSTVTRANLAERHWNTLQA